jgi:hypothetical protein
MTEPEYQAKLKKKIKELLPGCIVQKEDSREIQGIPDLLILYNNKWASLEVKIDEDAEHQPNQDYYVDKMDGMSFSRFIFPENEEQVLNELLLFFGGGE